MNWVLITYIAASLLISFGVGVKCVEYHEVSGHSYRAEDFSCSSFFISAGILTIIGIFLFKYNVL